MQPIGFRGSGYSHSWPTDDAWREVHALLGRITHSPELLVWIVQIVQRERKRLLLAGVKARFLKKQKSKKRSVIIAVAFFASHSNSPKERLPAPPTSDIIPCSGCALTSKLSDLKNRPRDLQTYAAPAGRPHTASRRGKRNGKRQPILTTASSSSTLRRWAMYNLFANQPFMLPRLVGLCDHQRGSRHALVHCRFCCSWLVKVTKHYLFNARPWQWRQSQAN